MKQLVCISKTPDTTSRISFVEDSTKFDTDGIQYIMNPYDEWYALVKALEVKEQVGGSITVINVGDASSEQIIRKALAIGADDAIRVDKLAEDAGDVAAQIAAVAKNEAYDLIYTGKETIDYNNSEVGSRIAAHLDLPFISYANALSIEGDTFTIARDIEGGSEVLTIQAPFVLSASKGLAEQRIPNMRGIMMAKRKPLEVKEAVAYQATSKIVEYEKPEGRTSCKLVDPDNMNELVRLLHEEAKVI